MNLRIFIFSLLPLLFLSGLSCSQKSSPAKISLQLQEKANSALSSEIDMVIVNVSGGNLPLRVFEWECKNEGVDCSKVSFEIQASEGVLVQLLVITEDTTNITRVNYGDVSANISPGDNNLSIPLAEVGNFSSEARMMGRYIPDTGSALVGEKLTGILEMVVPVGANKPPMKIMNLEIFAGWVNLFVIDNIGFKYLFTGHNATGTFYNKISIFEELTDGTGLKISSPGLQASTNERVHYYSSLQVYEERDGTYQQQPFRASIVGFFGRNPDSRILCSKSVSPTTLLDGNNGTSRVCKAITGNQCSDYFKWSDISVTGSVNGTDGLCVGGNPLELEIDIEDIGSGHDELYGVFGPFAEDPASGNDMLEVDESNSQIKWRINDNVYLPNGVEVFIRTLATSFSRDDVRARNDGILCSKLANHGFSSQGTILAQNGSLTLSATDFTNPNLKVALCPKRTNGTYYRTAILSDGDHDQSGPPSKIKLAKVSRIDGFTSNVYGNTCYPFSLELRDDRDLLARSNSSFPITLTGNDFYDNLSDCEISSPSISSVSINDSKIIYFKSSGAPATNYTLQASSAGLTTGSFNVHHLAPPAFSDIKLVADFYRKETLEVAKTEKCVRFYVAGFSAEGELVPFGGGRSLEFHGATHSPAGVVKIFPSEAACNSGTGEFSTVYGLPNGSNESLLPIWVEVPSSNGPITNLFSSCSSIPCGNLPTINVVSPGSLDHFHVDSLSPGPYSAGAPSCIKLKLGAYDDSQPHSYPQAFPAAGNFNLTANVPGNFYSDPGCSSSISNVPVTTSVTEVEVYFQWSATSPGVYELEFEYDVSGEKVEFSLGLQ